jgi:hypothetical protein
MRRLVVPLTIRLDRLHLTLQAAFGWTNTHLHAFTAGGVEWDGPEPDFPAGDQLVNARKIRLYDIVRETGAKTIATCMTSATTGSTSSSSSAGSRIPIPSACRSRWRLPAAARQRISAGRKLCRIPGRPRRRGSSRPCRSTGNSSGRLRSHDSRSNQAGTPGRRTRTKMATALRAQVTCVKPDPVGPCSPAYNPSCPQS